MITAPHINQRGDSYLHPITIDGVRLTEQEAGQLAKFEGFPAVEELVEFFETEHGLPFEGALIVWGTDCARWLDKVRGTSYRIEA